MELSKDLLDQIVLAHRDPAGKQEQVGFKSIGNEFPQAEGLVRGDRKQSRLTSRSCDLCCQRVAVGIANLRWTGRNFDIDDLVAGGQNRHGWFFVHEQMCPAYRG